MNKQAKLSEHLALAGGVETSNHVTVDGRSACKQIINLSDNEKRRGRWTHVQRPLISLNCSSDYLTESAATIAATATNMNTNFFIFLMLFKSVKQSFVY